MSIKPGHQIPWKNTDNNTCWCQWSKTRQVLTETPPQRFCHSYWNLQWWSPLQWTVQVMEQPQCHTQLTQHGSIQLTFQYILLLLDTTITMQPWDLIYLFDPPPAHVGYNRFFCQQTMTANDRHQPWGIPAAKILTKPPKSLTWKSLTMRSPSNRQAIISTHFPPGQNQHGI